jgi:K+-transporting ATPase c subunit
VQLAELRKSIEDDQRMYVQWAEEKLSLATIAVDLVQQHRSTIDLDISALLAELKVPIFACCIQPVSCPLCSHHCRGSIADLELAMP